MSTWICKHVSIARVFLVGCLVLAGCEEFEIPGLESSKPDAPSSEPVTRVELTTARVSIGGPYGFCVDPRSVRKRAAQGSAVFGNCAAITGSGDAPQPYSEALVTTTVTRLADDVAAGFADTMALETYLRSDKGRAALSQSGKAEDVAILDSFVTRKAAYVRLKDASAKSGDALAKSHWRSVFALPKAAVFISVHGLEGGSLSPSDGLYLVREFTGNTKSALGT